MPSGPAPPCDCRVNAQQRIRCLHGRVRPEDQPDPGPFERAPGVGVCGDPRPVLIRELAIGDGVDRLHRGDGSRAFEPAYILRIHALRMLDARPPVAPRAGVRCQRVESASHGRVADGVQAHVEPGPRAPRDDVRQIFLAQPSGSGAIQHLRGPAAERAVEEGFDAPHPQPRVAPAGADSHPLRMRQVSHRQVVGHPYLQPALRVEPLQRAEGARAVHRVDCGHS